MSPEQMALKLAMEFLEALLEAGPRLFDLFKRAGGRDGFISAIDITLAAARAKTDADLAKKHRGE
jgi:hypothetical protein